MNDLPPIVPVALAVLSLSAILVLRYDPDAMRDLHILLAALHEGTPDLQRYAMAALLDATTPRDTTPEPPP